MLESIQPVAISRINSERSTVVQASSPISGLTKRRWNFLPELALYDCLDLGVHISDAM